MSDVAESKQIVSVINDVLSGEREAVALDEVKP